MIPALLGLLVVASPAQLPRALLPGLYVTSQTEMAGALELQPNGRWLQLNDIGNAAFRSEPLTVEHSMLIMHRYDTQIVFRRANQ